MDRGGRGGRGNYYRGGWRSKAYSHGKKKKIGQGRGQGSTRGSRGSDNGNTSNFNQTNDNTPTRVSSTPSSDEEDAEDQNVTHEGYQRKKERQTTIGGSVIRQLKEKYPGFYLYFASLAPELSDPNSKIEAVMDFLLRNACKERTYLLEIEDQERFDLTFEEFINDQEFFVKSWPTFVTDFDSNPDHVLKIIGLAMHQIIFDAASEIDKDDEYSLAVKKPEINLPYIRAGLMRNTPVTPLRSIKASLLGKYVTVRGAVVRMGTNKFQCTRMTFRCGDCDKEFYVEQPEGIFTPPKRCGATEICENTKKDNFEPITSAKTTKVIEFRRIRIQDVENSRLEHGRVPRTIDCDLYYDMVNHCGAGDAVTLCGIVRLGSESSHGSADKAVHSLYIEVFAMKNNNDSALGGGWISYSEEDNELIRDIFAKKNLFRYLVASLCPSIYGHELVKAGILLSLFGGTQPEKNVISCRPDINILMVGDPGLGKSQMLKIVTQVAPRGVYVCGSGSTTAGLTVTLVKEGNSYSLDAGALVLADKGTCCIDEFDKMQTQHSALLEAMEQQSVSLAKAGVFRTLPARTSVIAAANPVGGHYDDFKTVSQNIKISAPLLSRFDLIFIMKDKPNTEYDRNIVEHVTGFAHKGRQPIPKNNDSEHYFVEYHQPLLKKLKFDSQEEVKILEHDKLRKYIAYAKQYVKPKLSQEAVDLIKEHYLYLRRKHRHIDSTPITMRQLESLVRLAQARAKLELREEVTEDDVKDILAIFDYSMSGVFESDRTVISGLSQNSSGKAGSARSQSKNMGKKLISALQISSDAQSKSIFTIDEIKSIAVSSKIPIDIHFDSLIDKLNNDGFLLKKGPKVYKFQCGG